VQLILLRHGLPESTQPAAGPPDPDLSDGGRDQACRTARWLSAEHIDVVLSSPLGRAVQTAEPTAADHDLGVQIDPGFREIYFGEDSYVPAEQLQPDSPHAVRFRAVLADESHELLTSFRVQVRDALADVAARYAGGTVLVASHGGVINAALAETLGVTRTFSFDIGYASLTRMRTTRSGRFRVCSVNEEGHLRLDWPPALGTTD
jgi:probable phosphoglycerate mutase